MPRTRRRGPNLSSDDASSVNDKENAVKKAFSKEDVELARAALVNAVQNDATESTRPFLNLFGAASSNTNVPVTLKLGLSLREQREILLHCLKNSSKQHDFRKFFASLKTLVSHVIERQEFIPESAFVNNDEDDDKEVVPDARSSEGLAFLYYATLCVTSYFTGQAEKHKQHQIPTEVLETAVTLHDILDQLDLSWGPDAAQTHQAIVSLCETWWLHDGVSRDDLIGQALPAIVEAALHHSKSGIKRLFGIRSALQIIDFDDIDSNVFLSLLMRVTSSPACLKSAEGKRFLSHLFSLGPTVRRKLHQSIRAQIPDNKTSILKDYGDVYFAAWKDAADDDTREAIEAEILQDLTYAVIHAANPGLVQNLRTVLEKFHDGKQAADVEALLHRMYGPILWRALSAANAKVRANATAVLAQVFPLPDRFAKKDHLQKGCAALKQLLQDPDPRVRVAGSEAVANILTVYWDVVPSSEIRTLLNHLVAEHASDASSSTVRAGAVNAVTIMLEAPQSYAVLREILPSLGNLIHDKVEKVRLAVVCMLLRIKKIPDFKYYHIVPLDHLAARFAEEGKSNPTNSVASALTNLMVNSYFPIGPDVESTEQIRRALKFVTDDPDAASVFFANVFKYRPLNAVAQLTVQLLRFLHFTVEEHLEREKVQVRATADKRRRFTKGNKAESVNSNDENISEPVSIEVMANLAENICTMWQSIEVELKGYEEWNQFILDEFSGPKLTTILSYLENKALNACSSDDDEDIDNTRVDCYRTCSAILRCAGRLPSRAVEGLVPYISSVLKSVEEPDHSESQEENVTAHIALLCLWDMTDEVAPSLAMSIQSAFYEDPLFGSPTVDSKKRRSGKSRRSDTTLAIPQLPPRVALNVLGDILRGSDPTCKAAREAILNSKTACGAIERALEGGTRQAERLLDGDPSAKESDAKYLLEVCEVFGRFALHKEAFANGSVEFSEQAKLLLHWTTAKVIPALSRLADPRSPAVPFIDPNLSSICVEKSFDTFTSSPEPVGRPRRRVNRNRTPERLDEGLGIFDHSPDAMQSTLRVGVGAAVSLLNSSCVLFSEWLAVGGAGASFVAQAAADWCRIFENSATKDEMHNELAPAFWRLTMQLAKTANDYSLMKQLLIKFHDGMTGEDEASLVRTALASLLATRGNQSDEIAIGLVNCVIDAASEILENETSPLKFELPMSLGTLSDSENGCIISALCAILGNQSASLELARQLVERFSAHAQESTRIALFDAKILWVLCNFEGGSKIVAEASEMVRQLNSEGVENELGKFVEELMDACKPV